MFFGDFIFYLAFAVMFISYSYYPELFKFDFNVLMKFTKFLTIVLAMKVVVETFILHHTDFYFPEHYHIFNSISIHSVLAVYWEDAIFVLPFLFFWHKFKEKAIWFLPLFIASTIAFAAGHLHQGNIGWVTIIYPPLALYFSKKHGISTIMACHIIYDIVVITAANLLPITLGLLRGFLGG
jgi:hypothetical protein